MNNIDVKPSDRPSKVAVATDEIGGTHYPVYKVSYGDLGTQTPVSEENPLPVTNNTEGLLAAQLATDNDLLGLLSDIKTELKIMNLYNAMSHNQELTKEDVS